MSTPHRIAFYSDKRRRIGGDENGGIYRTNTLTSSQLMGITKTINGDIVVIEEEI